MLKSVERLLGFVGDMNAIDGDWLDGWNRAVLATEKIEKEVSERYMELPLDADGVPIRVGDVLSYGDYKFKVFELAAFGDGSWSIRNEDGNAWAACDVTHYHKPTVENVLRDMLDSLDLDPTSHVDTGAVIAEYAQRLQLREVDE